MARTQRSSKVVSPTPTSSSTSSTVTFPLNTATIRLSGLKMKLVGKGKSSFSSARRAIMP